VAEKMPNQRQRERKKEKKKRGERGQETVCKTPAMGRGDGFHGGSGPGAERRGGLPSRPGWVGIGAKTTGETGEKGPKFRRGEGSSDVQIWGDWGTFRGTKGKKENKKQIRVGSQNTWTKAKQRKVAAGGESQSKSKNEAMNWAVNNKRLETNNKKKLAVRGTAGS